jgi:hypothetical protein
MRILWLAGVVLGLSASAAPAAILISVPPARSAAAAPPPASASPVPAPATVVPPAAVAGLIGLVALGFAFRPRRSALPEVTS